MKKVLIVLMLAVGAAFYGFFGNLLTHEGRMCELAASDARNVMLWRQSGAPKHTYPAEKYTDHTEKYLARAYLQPIETTKWKQTRVSIEFGNKACQEQSK